MSMLNALKLWVPICCLINGLTNHLSIYCFVSSVRSGSSLDQRTVCYCGIDDDCTCAIRSTLWLEWCWANWSTLWHTSGPIQFGSFEKSGSYAIIGQIRYYQCSQLLCLIFFLSCIFLSLSSKPISIYHRNTVLIWQRVKCRCSIY